MNERKNSRKAGDVFTVVQCKKCGEYYEPICELPHKCKKQNSYPMYDQQQEDAK